MQLYCGSPPPASISGYRVLRHFRTHLIPIGIQNTPMCLPLKCLHQQMARKVSYRTTCNGVCVRVGGDRTF